MNIFENIEFFRKKSKKTQEAVAKKMGITQSAYSNYVNRNDDIPIGRLTQIANILKIPLIDIITHPIKYVPESEIKKECENCKEKDIIIRQLTNYITILEGKIK